MPLGWMKVDDLSFMSFNTLLLLEHIQISWLPETDPSFQRNLGIALRGNPTVEWYLRHTCPEIEGWLDGIMQATERFECSDEVRAAIAIFDSTSGHSDVDGVQAEGRAEAVSDKQVPELWELYLTRYPMYRSYSSEVVMSTSPSGLYRFTPNALYKLDSASTDGDRRLPIDIAALLARPPAY